MFAKDFTMKATLWIVSVLMLGPDSRASAQGCSSSQPVNIKLSITSRRNVTGHWQMLVNALTDEPRTTEAMKNASHLAIDVGHSSSTCDDTKTVQITSEVTVSPTHPPDYEVVNGLGYYKRHNVAKTWDEARDTCIREGAHLIVPNSDEEADVVRTYFASRPPVPNSANDDFVHVGFHDRYVEGQYVTVTGYRLIGGFFHHCHGVHDDGTPSLGEIPFMLSYEAGIPLPALAGKCFYLHV